MISTSLLGSPLPLHPISQSEFGIAWRIIKRNSNIPTPPNLLYTYTSATSHSPRCNLITWGNIVLILLDPLGVLERHATAASQLLRCIQITIKSKAFDSFLKGFVVIERQPHSNPDQNYRWCDALVR